MTGPRFLLDRAVVATSVVRPPLGETRSGISSSFATAEHTLHASLVRSVSGGSQGALVSAAGADLIVDGPGPAVIETRFDAVARNPRFAGAGFVRVADGTVRFGCAGAVGALLARAGGPTVEVTPGRNLEVDLEGGGVLLLHCGLDGERPPPGAIVRSLRQHDARVDIEALVVALTRGVDDAGCVALRLDALDARPVTARLVTLEREQDADDLAYQARELARFAGFGAERQNAFAQIAYNLGGAILIERLRGFARLGELGEAGEITLELVDDGRPFASVHEPDMLLLATDAYAYRPRGPAGVPLVRRASSFAAADHSTIGVGSDGRARTCVRLRREGASLRW